MTHASDSQTPPPLPMPPQDSPPAGGMPPPLPPVDPRLSEAGGKKLAAGLCAILVGSLGVHKFILGYTTAGIIMLLVTLLTCGMGSLVMHVIGIVEGVMYLTRSDAEFHQMYIVNRKEWF